MDSVLPPERIECCRQLGLIDSHPCYGLANPSILQPRAVPTDRRKPPKQVPDVRKPLHGPAIQHRPALPHDRPVGTDVHSREVGGRNTPAGGLPVQREERNTGWIDADAGVLGAKVAMYQSRRDPLTALLHPAP